MIRDEFEKQSNKKVTSKEVIKIKKMGERAFYTSQIMKLKELRKPMKITAIVSIVCGLVIMPIVVLGMVVDNSLMEDYKNWLYVIFGGLLLLFGIVWLCIVWPLLKKKVKVYEAELKIITDREIEKKRKAYETIIMRNQPAAKAEGTEETKE